MTRESPLSRRTLLKVTGAATAATLVAGCNGNGDDDDDEEVDTDPDAWEDVDEIEFISHSSDWEGVAPEMIEGVMNPEVVLFEGEDYTFTWENDDGGNHNIAIWDDNEDVVGDYATETTSEQGATQELEVTASDDMAEYVCEPHASPGMRGDIIIED